MRMLLKSWAPLPLSALVLSSLKGATRRVTARGARGLKSPAWVYRGGGDGESGVLGALAASSMSGRDDTRVPLVQQIYDELRTMADAEREAKMGADSPVLAKVLKLMDSLEAQDLGISEEHFEGLTHSISMPIFVSGREPFGDEEETDPSFDLAIFVIPAGGGIPLHDHPHMSVLSRILFGSLEVDSYDVLDGRGTGEVEEVMPLRQMETRNFLQKAKAMMSLTRGAESHRGSGGGMRNLLQARSQRRRRVDASSPSFLLTPAFGNIHTFRAPVTCAVFDVLVPPYDESLGRSCSYYRILSKDGGNGGAYSRESHEGDEGDASTRRGSANAAGQGDGNPMTAESRVILEQIPEPMDLPRYSPYRGPMLVRSFHTGRGRGAK